MISRIWVNGQEGATLDAGDSAVLHGVGVFETMRTYRSSLFRWKAHQERLRHSARSLQIPFEEECIEREVMQAVGEDLCVRITLTGSGNRVVQSRPIDPEYIGRPRRVAPIEWTPSVGLPGDVKHTSRASWLASATALGVDEVLLCSLDGRILEANRSNVFAVLGGRLKTPPLCGEQLAGVTRGALLEAAARIGLPVDEEDLPTWAPFEAFYLSSTLKELAPVSAIGEETLPVDHPLGLKLLTAFRELVARETV